MVMLPSNIKTEKITHWVATPDAFGGHTFGTPAVLNGRWEDTVERFINFSGEEANSTAVCYLDTDVDTGDYLFQGESAAADPTTLAKAFRIERFKKTPDLALANHERKVWM